MPTELTTNTADLPGRTRVRNIVIDGVMTERELHIDATETRACAALWATGNYTQLHIGSYENPELESVECLRHFGNITRLHVMVPGTKIDLAPVAMHAPTLAHFSCNDDTNSLLDLSGFDALESLTQRWDPKMAFGHCAKLRSLALMRFSPKSKDLSPLPEAPNLRELSLPLTGVSHLVPLDRWPLLEALRLMKARQLESIAELTRCRALKALTLEQCPRVRDLSLVLPRLTTLERLDLEKCPDLTDLGFTERMTRLARLNFLDTQVLDGDMSPLTRHPRLEHVVFTSKKHFSHTEGDIRPLLQRRTGA